MLDFRTLRSTVAHGVQEFIHRLFHVVKMGTKLTIFGQNIFFPAACFCKLVLFWSPFLKWRVQAAHEFFSMDFFCFLLPIVFLPYNCSTIVHLTPHSFEWWRAEQRLSCMYNILLIILIKRHSKESSMSRLITSGLSRPGKTQVFDQPRRQGTTNKNKH